MTIQIRDLRRNFGLSQSQLADLMGTTQSTISRWERGTEHIRHSKRLELIDLFSNRNGKLDPIVEYLARHNQNISAFDFNYNCLLVSDIIGDHLQLEPNNVIGQNYAQMIDTEWFSSVYGDVPLEERLYFEYERVMSPHPNVIDHHLAIRSRQFFVRFQDSAGVMLAIIDYAPHHEKPKVIESVTTDALEFKIG
ncbi:MAG: helix-turn-helix transcriptional regulator [Rhizobiaceae bacterium]